MPTWGSDELGVAFGAQGDAALAAQESRQASLLESRKRLPTAAQAAVESENIFVSLAIRAQQSSREGEAAPVAGYNPYKDPQLEDERLKGLEHAFTESRSPEETGLIRDRVLRGMDNRASLNNAGAAGMAWILAANIADPINAIPGIGEAIKAESVGGAFVRGAASAFVSGLSEEMILQQLQDERPDLDETQIKNMVAMSTMFGALGAFAKGIDNSTTELLLKERVAEMDDIRNVAEKVTDEGWRIDPALSAEDNFSAWTKVAQKVAPEMSELAAKGSWRGKALKALFEFGPGRTASSPFDGVRKTLKILSDTSGFLTKFEEGGGTFGPAVETRAHAWRVFHLTAGVADMNDAFDAYRKAGGQEIAKARDFYSAVGRAMRRGDQAAEDILDPALREAVSSAAKSLRKQTIDPLWESAVDVGLYHTVDADLKGTAPSYFMRVYDRERIKGLEVDGMTFRDTLANWLRRNPDKLKKGETPESLAAKFEHSILKTDKGTVHMGMVREAGPLKDRVLLIPDKIIEPWLVDDAAQVAGRYVNTIAGEVELARAFREAFPDEIKAIQGRLDQLRSDLAGMADPVANQSSGPPASYDYLVHWTTDENADSIRKAGFGFNSETAYDGGEGIGPKGSAYLTTPDSAVDWAAGEVGGFGGAQHSAGVEVKTNIRNPYVVSSVDDIKRLMNQIGVEYSDAPYTMKTLTEEEWGKVKALGYDALIVNSHKKAYEKYGMPSDSIALRKSLLESGGTSDDLNELFTTRRLELVKNQAVADGIDAARVEAAYADYLAAAKSSINPPPIAGKTASYARRSALSDAEMVFFGRIDEIAGREFTADTDIIESYFAGGDQVIMFYPERAVTSPAEIKNIRSSAMQAGGNTAREIGERIQNERAVAAFESAEMKKVVRDAIDREKQVLSEVRGYESQIKAERSKGRMSRRAMADELTRLKDERIKLREDIKTWKGLSSELDDPAVSREAARYAIEADLRLKRNKIDVERIEKLRNTTQPSVLDKMDKLETQQLEAMYRLDEARAELKGHREAAREFDSEIRVTMEFSKQQLQSARTVEQVVNDLEADLAEVRRKYARRGVNMEPQKDAIKAEFDEKISQAKTAKERQKLYNRLQRDLGDLNLMRDRILGHAGIPDDPQQFAFRVSQSAKRLNLARFGGTFGLSSATDSAHVALRHGFKPMGKYILNALQPLKAAKKSELSRLLWASEMTHAARRSMSMADIVDDFVGGTRLEKGIKAVSDHASKWFGIDIVNGAQKASVSLIASDEFLKLSKKIADGTITAKKLRQLAQVGIDKKMAQRIVAMAEHWEADEAGKFFVPRLDRWTDAEAATTFRTAVLASVHNTIIEPGVADLPAIMSQPVLSSFLQFKSFMFATNNRILASALNEPDMATLAAMSSLVAWGGLIYGLKQLNAGRDFPDSPAALAYEAVDNSGALGIITDANNMLERATGYGLNRVLGGTGPSRYQSRNAVDAILGPSIGTISDFSAAANALGGALTGNEIPSSGVHATRRLLPLQNFVGIRQGLDHLEEVLK